MATVWPNTQKMRFGLLSEEAILRPSLLLVILIAWGLRLYTLPDLALRWDEGWSLGMASLPTPEIFRVTALDVHPPLYYFLLKTWVFLGKNEYLLRFPSVFFGLLSVPLAYALAAALWDRKAGLLPAILVAFLPPLVYYSQVARMFALSATAVLLAAYGAVRLVHPPQNGEGQNLVRPLAFLITGGIASLFTFYYTAPVILALFLYALVSLRRQRKAIIVAFGTIGLFYLPWAIYAFYPLLERVQSRTGFSALNPLPLLWEGFTSLVLAYGPARPLAYVVLGLLLMGILVGKWSKPTVLVMPGVAILLALLAVALGAPAHMFAARYTIAASPFLALLLGWALAAILARSRILLALAVVSLAVFTLPSLAQYAYPKPFEVSGPFDPSSDWQFLRENGARNTDLVFFNVLSLAGTYERYRTAQDPAWSYALRWDPVIEPLEEATSRISSIATQNSRLWFVLYKGSFAANYDLKYFLDTNLFPAYGQWQGDTLYLLYLSPIGPWEELTTAAEFENGVVLEKARFTPRVSSGGEVGVTLVWRPTRRLTHDYKVFIHLYDANGNLIAQHDSVPVNELRPTSTWRANETVEDRHGVALPFGSPSFLRLIVGLYDPQTGQRLTVGRADSIAIGEIRVQ